MRFWVVERIGMVVVLRDSAGYMAELKFGGVVIDVDWVFWGRWWDYDGIGY